MTQIMVFGFNNKPKFAKTRSQLERPQSPKEGVADPEVTVASNANGGVEKPAKTCLFSRLRSGLSKTSKILNKDLAKLLRGTPDENLLEELETRLLMADVGVEATQLQMGKVECRSFGTWSATVPAPTTTNAFRTKRVSGRWFYGQTPSPGAVTIKTSGNLDLKLPAVSKPQALLDLPSSIAGMPKTTFSKSLSVRLDKLLG